jgi:hypothetical protein
MRILLPFFLTALVLFNASPVGAAPYARLTLHSQPGDFVGQGKDFDVEYFADRSIAFFGVVSQVIGAPPGQPAQVFFNLWGTQTDSAGLTFGTDKIPLPIAPGTYLNAERASFASPGHPGLDVTFQGNGCNTVTGMFRIDEITFGDFDVVHGQQNIARFRATFEQHCEGAAPALFGTLFFDVAGPPQPVAAAPVPLSVFPIALMLAIAGAFAVRKSE